jgi:hypothetical protein
LRTRCGVIYGLIFHLDPATKNQLATKLLYAKLAPSMTAYNRQKLTTSEAAAKARARRRKKLAAWWKRAGYIIPTFTKRARGENR